MEACASAPNWKVPTYIIKFFDIIKDKAAIVMVVPISTREQHTINFAKLLQSDLFRFPLYKRDHSCTSSLNPIDICLHYVSFIPTKPGVVMHLCL